MQDAQVAQCLSEKELLRIAAPVECPSEHQLACTTVDAVSTRDRTIAPVEDLSSVPGTGMRTTAEGRNRRPRRLLNNGICHPAAALTASWRGGPHCIPG
ncbi:hypothetical protein AB0O47_19130 [Streptomyces noursei]|uniref:hypothetical protein n=1 Tax=Streptomyces noursei TaxID=1971 RepID=UPI00344BBCDE